MENRMIKSCTLVKFNGITGPQCNHLQSITGLNLKKIDFDLPPNSGGALALLAPPLSTLLNLKMLNGFKDQIFNYVPPILAA